MSRQKKKYVAIENATFANFFLLLCWNYLIFQLKPTKHKVGEYSKFGIKIYLKLLKICQKNGLKLDEFRIHQRDRSQSSR